MIPLLLARTETHHFAFRREDVDSVLLLPRLQRHPGDIPLIEGWLNLRGHMVPCISLAGVLGLPPEAPRLSDHLVLTVASPRVAWRLRRVDGLGQVGWESLSMLEHSAEPTPCYVAQFQHEGHSTSLLNVTGLLLAEEQERVGRAEAKRARRLGNLAPVDGDRLLAEELERASQVDIGSIGKLYGREAANDV